MSQVISLRLDDDVIAKLQSLKGDDETLHTTAKRILMDSLGIQRKQPVNNDERLQELIDAKTAYLATALNDLRRNLEDELTQLKTEIEVIRVSQNANSARGGSKVLTKK